MVTIKYCSSWEPGVDFVEIAIQGHGKVYDTLEATLNAYRNQWEDERKMFAKRVEWLTQMPQMQPSKHMGCRLKNLFHRTEQKAERDALAKKLEAAKQDYKKANSVDGVILMTKRLLKMYGFSAVSVTSQENYVCEQWC